jgi:uncharacterized protein YndB with AHSA1/START domain
MSREMSREMGRERTSMEIASDTLVVIKRTFRAPARIVFDAYTQAEHVRRWWAPESRGVTVVACDVDLTPGGTYRYVLAKGDEPPFAFSGSYLEISRPTRLVYTQRFEPVAGTALPGEVVVTVLFEEREGTTLMVAHERYPSKEVRDMALSSGMEDGMRETFDRLDDLVAALSDDALPRGSAPPDRGEAGSSPAS